MTTMREIEAWSVTQIAERVASGDVSAEQVTDVFLGAAARRETALRAFLYLDRDRVIDQARAIDLARRAGRPCGPLCGVPVAVKDALCTRDIPTSCASRILHRAGRAWLPPYDATAVERLRGAGAVVFGKTNLDEFAMGSSTENSAFHPTHNPWALDRVPGGSSGGSAVAVAARMVPGALGSDTGGSIRQPAALTHTVGIKPTYGRVSRFGLVAFASSLDQVGPFANDVRGAARILEVIAGRDPRDATTADTPVGPIEGACGQDVRGMRVGIPDEYFGEGIDGDVARRVREAIDALRDAGCIIVPVSLPHTRFAIATYYVIATAEASSNLARFDGVRFGFRSTPERGDLTAMYGSTRAKGFGVEVRRRIMLGTYVLSAGYYEAYYLKAQRVRTLIRRDFEQAFRNVDVIVTPTSPTPAWKLGEKLDDPLAMYLADVFTLPASLAGVPAISLPAGFTSATAQRPMLPVGLQIIAPPFAESNLCRVAAAWEARNPARNALPPIVAEP